MLRTGKVVAACGGELEVCFERPEACAHCGACAGQKEKTLARIPGDVPAGRWIEVDMPETQVLKASVLASGHAAWRLGLGQSAVFPGSFMGHHRHPEHGPGLADPASDRKAHEAKGRMAAQNRERIRGRGRTRLLIRIDLREA